MYLIDTQVAVEWTLEKTSKTVLISDLSIITVTPLGGVSFVQIGNLIPPTTDTKGLINHLFTPDSEGLWEVTLVKGDPETYTELSRATFYVFANDVTVEPLGYSDGSLEILGI